MEWQIAETAPGELLLERDGTRTRAFVAGAGATRWVFIEGRTWEIEIGARRPSSGQAPREGQGQPPRMRSGQSGGAGALAAPMPATVVRIFAKPGAAVRKGDTLILLEAMKMELPLRAPQDGTVKALRCQEGELVQAGTVLIDLN